MKLCIFQPFAERRGGSDNILLTFLTHLDRERIDPLVVFFGEGGFEREVAAMGIRTRTLPYGRMRNPVHLVRSSGRARDLLEEEHPDLVLNWLSTAHVHVGPAARRAGMSDRTLWWQLDLFGERLPDHARLADRLATARGRMLDRVATAIPAVAIGCCSVSVQRAQDRIRPRRPTFSVLPGIDQPPMLPGDSLEALRSELGLPRDAIVVGIVGRLFAWKGHHLLARALADLRREEPRIHGLFVGGGGHRQDAGYQAFLRSTVDELGLDGQVTFTGQVPDATPYIQVMDVFVNASAPEPFGLVVLEAMSLGVPVVAVDAGGPAEIIRHGESGLLAPTNAPAALAAEIRKLASDPALRGRISANGRTRYEERFTGTTMAAEMSDRLLELVP